MRKFLYAALACLLLTETKAQVCPTLLASADSAAMNAWVDSVFAKMSEDERIGQSFMVLVFPRDDAKSMNKLLGYVRESKIGGVLFRAGKPATQAAITNRIQKAAHVPLLIALDGEWGLSMRLSGTTRFPRNMMLGAINDPDLIEAYGAEVGRQCREMGIHVNFAPVLDVNTNADNPVIGNRSFGEKPLSVAEKGIAYSGGLERMGVIAVAKHFPGHGDTSEDSHFTLPAIHRSAGSLDSVELQPFREYINRGFSGVMVAHLHVPALDGVPDAITSQSQAVVTGLLKEKMGFQGLCFTDALEMKGASANASESPSLKALLAGNDIVLSPEAVEKEIAAVKKAVREGVMKREEMHAKCKKILQYKYMVGLNDFHPVRTEGLSERLNTPHADWLAAKLNEEAITILKNERQSLPLRQLDEKKIALISVGDAAGGTFREMLNRYAPLASFKVTGKTTESDLKAIAKALDSCNFIICGIHSTDTAALPALRRIGAGKTMVYTFFTQPYFCRKYADMLADAEAVVMAFENSPLAQSYAAQAIFGGIAAKGNLSVTIPGLFSEGTGYATAKCRLGYHLPEEVGMDADSLKMIDAIVRDGLKHDAYPGCQVLVAKDGMIVYQKAFGHYDYQNKKEVTTNSVYDLASLSKVAGTLPAVMKACDEHLLMLDAPVSLYLPSLQRSNKADLRIEELLYHQSGLKSTIDFFQHAIDEKSYTGSLFSRKQNSTHPVRYDARTFVRNDFKFKSELVSKVRKKGFTTQVAKDFYLHDSYKDLFLEDIKNSPMNVRGKYVYSCINFILLKMIVERQTNRPMDQWLQASFYDRLGAWSMTYNPLKKMNLSLIVPTENDRFLRKQLLRGYVHDEAAAFQGGVSGNAGLFANANDLAKMLQLYLNDGVYGGETYFSAATCRLFTESKSPTCRRALGFDKPETDTAKVSPCGELAPPSVYGHTGYTGTCFWIDPDNRLIFIFLSNRVHPSRANNRLSSLNIRRRIQNCLYRSLVK